MLKGLKGLFGLMAFCALMLSLVACGGVGGIPGPTADPTTGSWRATVSGGSSGSYGSAAAADNFAYAVRVNEPESGQEAFALILLDETDTSDLDFYLAYVDVDGDNEAATLYLEGFSKIYVAENGVTGRVDANLSVTGNRVTGSLTATLEDGMGAQTSIKVSDINVPLYTDRWLPY